MTSSRTILIESNRLFRQGLKHLLADTRFAVEAEFSTMEQAVDGARLHDSGLVIIGERPRRADLSSCGMPIRKPASWCWPAISSVDALRDAMNAGADGFLMKDVSPEALIQSLELVMMGEKVFPTNLASMLLDMTARRRR